MEINYSLARKYRPKTFDELIGQKVVLQALINSLNNNKLHHAYLFTGTRGVGKTTLGRLFTKSLNCDNGITAKPCNSCSVCEQINNNSFIDLIEIDAASRTKVENTREIINDLQYVPTQGRFRVYLIDEVHMLSNSSFNALLKTIEEPPAHIKFIFATTNPEKLPLTILSRCLHFNLQPLGISDLESHMCSILEKEEIPFEQRAVNLIAKAGKGSVRDGLSILDQAIAFGDNKVLATQVEQMLGWTSLDLVHNLLNIIANKNHIGLSKFLQDVRSNIHNIELFIDQFIELLHQIMLYKSTNLIWEGEGNIDRLETIKSFSKNINMQFVNLAYSICLNGKKELNMVSDRFIGFEVLILRLFALAKRYITVQENSNTTTDYTQNVDAMHDTHSDENTMKAMEMPQIISPQMENTQSKEVLQEKKSHSLNAELKSEPSSENDDIYTNLLSQQSTQNGLEQKNERNIEQERIEERSYNLESTQSSTRTDNQINQEQQVVLKKEKQVNSTNKNSNQDIDADEKYKCIKQTLNLEDF